MTEETTWAGHPRNDCYFCRDDSDVLQEHHIVPRRHGGGDEDRNLVTLCPTCHEKIEQLYDRRFYQAIGVGDPARVVDFVTDYLITELNELEFDIQRRFNDTRDRLEGTHIHSDELDDDLREQINDAIADYHADDEGRNDNSQRDRVERIKDIISELEDEYEDGAPVDKIYIRAINRGMTEEKVEYELEKLRKQGSLYEPVADHLRSV